MNSYLLVKYLHLTTIGISFSGFLLRVYWRYRSPAMLQHRLVRIAPHVNDSLLLFSGIGLTLIVHQYPFTHNWLTAKLLLLLVYIVSGSVALKTRYSRNASLLALLLAVSAFCSMLLIATRHSV